MANFFSINNVGYSVKHGIIVFLITLLMSFNVQATVVYTLVTVGDAGNSSDSTTDLGGVSYIYKIGKYPVTIAQYTEFLNAVAQTDTYSLYSTNMAIVRNIAGISRSGSSGS